jgi:DNA-3-methyladenine glycosylase
VSDGLRPATPSDLAGLPLEVAPRLLGAVLHVGVGGETVAVRITEVEAYHGLGTGDVPDPASHARSGPTARNATMWGRAGLLYVYLSHGIHSCVNVVCGPEGVAGAVLLPPVAGSAVQARPSRRGSSPVVRAASRRRPGCGIRFTTASTH